MVLNTFYFGEKFWARNLNILNIQWFEIHCSCSESKLNKSAFIRTEHRLFRDTLNEKLQHSIIRDAKGKWADALSVTFFVCHSYFATLSVVYFCASEKLE